MVVRVSERPRSSSGVRGDVREVVFLASLPQGNRPPSSSTPHGTLRSTLTCPMTFEMSLPDFAYKVDSEGGIWSALEYGLRGSDVDDPEVAELWDQLADQFESMQPLRDEIGRRLSKAMD